MTVPELTDRADVHGAQVRDLLEILIDRLAGGDEAPNRLSTLAQAGDVATAADTIRQAITGTGLPIALPLTDPGDNDYGDALDPNPITRACTRLRVIVADSGVVISLDGGVTDSITVPADYADDIAVAIPAGADIRVKRYTAGTAITGLILEVR